MKKEKISEEVTASTSPEMQQELESLVDEEIKKDALPNKAENEEETPIDDDVLPPAENTPAVGDEKGGESPDEVGKTVEEPKESSISDDLLTRAVKAGMSVSDARSFQNVNALENICKTLEAVQKPELGKKDNPTGESDETDSIGDVLDGLPNLDPDEYDEGLIQMFDGLKALIKSQSSEIATLKTVNNAASKKAEVSFFDTKINSLGPEFKEAIGVEGKVVKESVQAKTRAELREKFDILSAGYKAAGKEVEQSAVFNDAVKMVLGDVVVASSNAAKKAALEKRSALVIDQPGSGKTRSYRETAEDVALAELNKKYPDN